MSAPTFTDAPPALRDAVDLARAAAVEEAADEVGESVAGAVGEHLGHELESDGALTHFFAAELPGYHGWRWAVSLACVAPDAQVTVNEVVLLPGQSALVAPAWVPWGRRVRPDDLKPGDLLPAAADDPRLVPGYAQSSDPAVEEVATEVGLGRERVLSVAGRDEAAQRWQDGEFGPSADLARAAPACCGTCGFLLPLAGAMRGVFGVCANEYSPADGQAVAAGFGCGAHSDVLADLGSPVHVSALVYDDGVDLEPASS